MKAILRFFGAPFRHLKSLGFTNRLALYIMAFLGMGLVGGFYLALKSIAYAYTGALACWTIVFTPIGTACSIVLNKIVDKSIMENTSADGDGIKYATARANGFKQPEQVNTNNQSPPI